MKYKKLIKKIPKQEMKIIDKACSVDKRTKSSLARKALLKESNDILKREVKKNEK